MSWPFKLLTHCIMKTPESVKRKHFRNCPIACLVVNGYF